jgi:hypothetical protein
VIDDCVSEVRSRKFSLFDANVFDHAPLRLAKLTDSCPICNFSPYNLDANSTENDLVIGVQLGALDGLLAYVMSLRSAGCRASSVVFVNSVGLAGLTPSYSSVLASCGVTLIGVSGLHWRGLKPGDFTWPKGLSALARWAVVGGFLRNYWRGFDRVLVTDVSDFVFQRDPFTRSLGFTCGSGCWRDGEKASRSRGAEGFRMVANRESGEWYQELCSNFPARLNVRETVARSFGPLAGVFEARSKVAMRVISSFVNMTWRILGQVESEEMLDSLIGFFWLEQLLLCYGVGSGLLTREAPWIPLDNGEEHAVVILMFEEICTEMRAGRFPGLGEFGLENSDQAAATIHGYDRLREMVDDVVAKCPVPAPLRGAAVVRRRSLLKDLCGVGAAKPVARPSRRERDAGWLGEGDEARVLSRGVF